MVVEVVKAMKEHTGDPPWGPPWGLTFLQHGHGMQGGGGREWGSERGWCGVFLGGPGIVTESGGHMRAEICGGWGY